MLAKSGGQVEFGLEESGWAQLILPLRLLLFYEVDISRMMIIVVVVVVVVIMLVVELVPIKCQDQPKNAAMVQRLMTHTEEKVSVR